MEDYAIVESGGKQYLIRKGDIVEFELIENAEKDGEVIFSNVLAITKSSKLAIGHPFVKGATVKGKLLEFTKGKKIHIFKKKRRKGYEKRIGHRQNRAQVEITEIAG